MNEHDSAIGYVVVETYLLDHLALYIVNLTQAYLIENPTND